jgi:hypothetical protein
LSDKEEAAEEDEYTRLNDDVKQNSTADEYCSKLYNVKATKQQFKKIWNKAGIPKPWCATAWRFGRHYYDDLMKTLIGERLVVEYRTCEKNQQVFDGYNKANLKKGVMGHTGLEDEWDNWLEDEVQNMMNKEAEQERDRRTYKEFMLKALGSTGGLPPGAAGAAPQQEVNVGEQCWKAVNNHTFEFTAKLHRGFVEKERGAKLTSSQWEELQHQLGQTLDYRFTELWRELVEEMDKAKI